MADTIRDRLRNGETLVGTMVTMASTDVVEIMIDAGFDWLFLDGEHGPLETADLRQLLVAAGDRVGCLIRIPASSETPIKKALDLGAAGIIAPQVNTAEAARQVVAWCRYPPEGSRGIGLARAHGFGNRFHDYVTTANERLAVVVQIEHRDAVANLESIVAVPGIDCLLLGPYDLSASFGCTGQLDHPDVRAAIDHVETVCRENAMPLGSFGLTAEAVQPCIDRGGQLVCVGVDTVMLSAAARSLRRGLARQPPQTG